MIALIVPRDLGLAFEKIIAFLSVIVYLCNLLGDSRAFLVSTLYVLCNYFNELFFLIHVFIYYSAETTFEVIPRLSKIKFDSGILDELLFLEKPHECRLASGIMLLEYAKVIEESIYDHMRVVREGQLRIIFTPDLKVINWLPLVTIQLNTRVLFCM